MHAHTATERVRSLSRKNWMLSRTLAQVRKGTDSPKPPQQRAPQGRSHTAEAAPTKRIRSNTSRWMNVLEEQVSRTTTHL